MKKLILIRHGETNYTLKNMCCGQKDIPLNAKGIKQTQCLRYQFKDVKIDKVYTSNLKRAIQTAKIVFPNKIIHKRKDLGEIDFGQFSGLTYIEIKKLFPNSYNILINSPAKAKMPNGETMYNFAKRVEESFNKILKENTVDVIALVSHINPIKIMLLKILGCNLDKFWELQQDVTAINVVKFENGKTKIIKMNDTSHLKNIY